MPTPRSDDRVVPRNPLVVICGGAAIYLLTPAAQAAPLGAWPLTPAGTLALAVAIGATLLAWFLPADDARARWTWPVVAVASCIVLRAVSALVGGTEGWLARYYANDAWQGQPEWSAEYRFSDATRIDRAIAFEPGAFPVFYLNSVAFEEAPAERDVALPMSVEWSGVFDLQQPNTVSVNATASGTVAITVDEQEVPLGADEGNGGIALDRGAHVVRVKYAKPAGVAGSLHVQLRRTSDNRAVVVVPSSAHRPTPAAVNVLAVVVDGVMALLLLGATASVLIGALQSERRVFAAVGTALMLPLGAQGFLTALPMTKFYTLTAGDDWLGFESRARNILEQGVLMPLGSPIGEGASYFYHPFYPYVLAALHVLTGESLFGPIFAHFLWLGGTAIVMFAVTRRCFGMWPAVCGALALVAVFELDFIRYYTVTLLSENLYVFTVTCCLAAFARWAESGRSSWLALAGLLGGVSAATRPVMMVFLPFALCVAAWIAYRRNGGTTAVRAALVLGVAWMAFVLPFTVRNQIVANEFVLISSGQGGAVIAHMVPPSLDPAPYLEAYRSGRESNLQVMWRLFVEHPAEVVALHFKKIGFTLGMVHWFEGYRPHPELVAVTVLYLATLYLSPAMRRPELWAMHAFVASHWASMLLTSPWNYGYRLILPAYVYTTALSAAAATALVSSVRPAHR